MYVLCPDISMQLIFLENNSFPNISNIITNVISYISVSQRLKINSKQNLSQEITEIIAEEKS